VLAGIPVVLLAVLIVLFRARSMLRRERYEFTVLSALWAMVPWTFGIGLLFGAWALFVLLRPQYKMLFVQRAVQQRLGLADGVQVTAGVAGVPAEPTGFMQRRLRSMFQAVRTLMVGTRIGE